MKFIKLSCAAIGILLGTSGLSYGSEEGFSLFSDSSIYFQFRPRYESADVDGGTDSADAFTTRTVLGGKFNGIFKLKGLNVNLEATNVSHFGLVDNYSPEQSSYDKIVDPTQTRFTKANMSYAVPGGGTTFIAGRQILTLDNHRYVGHVGWRQMPQTFDVITVKDKTVKGLNLTGAYVTRIHKITENGRQDTNSVILNGSYKFAPALKLTVYDYMLSSIHDTIGIRATGGRNFSGVKFNYEAEYATQDQASLKEESLGDIKPDHEADYYKLGFRVNYTGVVFGIDYEVLGEKEGTEGGAFNTPLATLHATNGWADKFLKTPASGLVDTTFTLGYISKSFGRIIALYRDFESDNGGYDFGNELDVIYAHKLTKNLGLTLKAAFYEEGDDLANNDTTKYWAMLDYRFNF